VAAAGIAAARDRASVRAQRDELADTGPVAVWDAEIESTRALARLIAARFPPLDASSPAIPDAAYPRAPCPRYPWRWAGNRLIAGGEIADPR
jgi:hypothetical protein